MGGAIEREEIGFGEGGVVEGDAALGGVDEADFVGGAGEVEGGDVDGGEGVVLVGIAGGAGAHDDGGFRARVDDAVVFVDGILFAGDGLGGDRAKGVAGDADGGEVEFSGEWSEVV